MTLKGRHMLGKQTDLLKALVTAADTWRTTTTAAGVALIQINVVFPDGKPVTLFYNDDVTDWEVSA